VLVWIHGGGLFDGASRDYDGSALARQQLAPQVPLYAYEFNDRSAPSYFPPVRFKTGAYHTADIQDVFPGNHGGDRGRPGAHDASPAAPVGRDDRLLVEFRAFREP
jgi:carboxylesterase type B